jgi:hypothetical protein
LNNIVGVAVGQERVNGRKEKRVFRERYLGGFEVQIWKLETMENM